MGWDPRRKAASRMLGMGPVRWPGVGWDCKGLHTHVALASSIGRGGVCPASSG